MNTRNWILTWTFAAASCLSLWAQPIRADLNPALRYYQAWLVAPDISEGDLDYLATNNLWSATLPQRFGQIAGRYDSEFKLLRQVAASTAPCDWGIDMSEGPATLLPHLARCKAAMIGARYRVAWALEQHREADARDDLLAAFTLARNISHDGTLISVLVQIAAERISCDIIAQNYGKLSTQTFQQVVQGIDAAPARRTVAASIALEKITFHDWLLRKVQELQKASPGDETKVMAGIRELLTSMDGTEGAEQTNTQPSLWEQVRKAGGNTSENVLELLRKEGQVYGRLAALMALPYAEFDSPAKQFALETSQSSNPFISQALPACLKARQREFAIQAWLAMLHTALAYRLHGDPGLLSVADPFGQGPFAFQRFVLNGEDRGFQLKSAFEGSGFPEILIFVEKPGPPFFLAGPYAGQARTAPITQK